MSLQAVCVHDDGREHPSDGTLPCPVVEAVEESYDPEGQRIWWAAWDKADAAKRRDMELVITLDGNCS